ncbi:phage baseplate protein [Xenorhabdus taiwanensis]|uniref:Dit-like phage tail protein N-terminal domain-containing protein n=1 Tax=Xenorhabdus taiwanensis TaxID=3085177 RepID=A0ABN7C2I4_9GAMM|nr:hypothetical protein TCT1_14860 [Xenorhabdus sp. TCT-1]
MFGMPELPKMPNIPNWKGIPDAAMDAGISLGGAALINKLFGNYWGIFNQYGIPLLLADSVISLQYQSQYRVVSAPIENGSFATYNKVGEPYKVTVQLSKSSGGTLERGAFLSQLEILAKSTLKFHVVTPEFVYTNAAIVGYDIAREAKDGATLLKVNLHLEEVREVKIKYDKEEVKNPDDAKKKDTGDQTSKIEAQVNDILDEILDNGKTKLKKLGDFASEAKGVIQDVWNKSEKYLDMAKQQMGGGLF